MILSNPKLNKFDKHVERKRLVLQSTVGQLEVLRTKKRFQIVTASRRWGKTVCAVMALLMRAVKKREQVLWYVGPTYRQVRKPFKLFLKSLKNTGLIKHVQRAIMTIELTTGAVIEFRSADRPDNLRGEGVSFLVLDEASLISEEAWVESIRPTLSDFNGGALIIFTPKGKKHWVYRMFVRGMNGDPLIKSFKFTIKDAVFIPRSEIEEARLTMNKRAFMQEFMAEFLEGDGSVYENIGDRKRGRWLAPRRGEPIAIGVDWAKKNDFSVFTAVGAESGHIVDMMRMNKFNYKTQVARLRGFVKKWYKHVNYMPTKIKVVYDKTGVGEAVGDMMLDAGIPGNPEGFVFSGKTKNDLIDESIIAWETGSLFWPKDGPEVIGTAIDEHEMYSLDVTERGRITYGAPDGFHDDTVISVSLANRARRGLYYDAGPIPTVNVLGDIDDSYFEEEYERDEEHLWFSL